MSTWNTTDVVLTTIGEEILSKVQSGIGVISISRIVSGGGSVSPALLSAQTAVTSIKQELTLSNRSATSGGSILNMYLTNTGLAAEYDLYQIGVYVNHQDYVGEQLYLIAQCDTASPDHIPLPEDTPVSLSFSIFMEHSSASALSVTISPTGMVTTALFNEHKDTVDAHLASEENPHGVTKTQVGLGNVSNLAPADLPLSSAATTALGLKVDKAEGKSLILDTLITKLTGIEEGAEVNINADWNAVSGDSQILNKPTLGTASSKNTGILSGNVPLINASNKLEASLIPEASDIGAVPSSRTVNSKALSADIVLSAGDVGAVPTTRTVNNKALSSNISLTATDVGAVPTTTTINDKALSGNIVLNAADVGARSSSWLPTSSEIDAVPKTRTINSKVLSANVSLTASDVGAVPTTRTVNSKALSADITLTAADVSAVPTTRTVNSKVLSADITLTAADVSAVPTTRTVNNKALNSNISLTASDVGAIATPITGSSTFVAAPSTRTITHNLGHTNYRFLWVCTGNSNGFLGEVSITKNANTVVVATTGSFTGAFDYIIISI